MNENQSTIAEKHEIIKPLIDKIDSIIDNCYRDCHNKFYKTFQNKCEQDTTLTINSNNETVNLTTADKSMNLYELKK